MATRAKLATVENALEEIDAIRAANLRIWNAVCRTDPRHTKKVNQRGGFTAIDAQYQIQTATEQFGPLGEGWGYDVGEFQIVGPLIIVPVTLWHSGDRGKSFGPILGCCEIAGQRPDRDAPKKAVTDAITKGLSQLGFNADVFLGLFDDNKYIAEVTAEFHSDPKPTAKEKDGDMSPTALRGSIKTLVRGINGCGKSEDLEDLLQTDDAVDVIEQCARRFPAWWETGEGCPPEFTPLKTLIAQTREGLKGLQTEDA